MANTCPETKSELKKENIKIISLSLHHNMYFLKYFSYDLDKREEMRASYSDREVYARFMTGEEVVMEYYDVQYFDDAENECLQTRFVKSVGGVRLSEE